MQGGNLIAPGDRTLGWESYFRSLRFDLTFAINESNSLDS